MTASPDEPTGSREVVAEFWINDHAMIFSGQLIGDLNHLWSSVPVSGDLEERAQ